jgi:hypothetical protein
MVFLLAVIVLGTVGPRLIPSISTNTILGVGVIAAALYAYRLFAAAPVNVWWRHRMERRRQQLEQAARYHTDKITRHLEHGEVPHLTDDGEIVFEKAPKHTSQSPEEDKMSAHPMALENQSDDLLDLPRKHHDAQDQAANNDGQITGGI